MFALGPCPPDDVLELLLRGRADPASAADLERHLCDCPRCGERAGRLAVADEIEQALRRTPAAGDTPAAGGPETVDWFGDPAADAGPGDRRLGPYVLREKLGAGGMGVVYRGYDPRLQREVAVKLVRPDLLSAPGVRPRFLAEARAAAAVEHDHIIAVHEVEEYDGVPCLVMPLLRGETLESRLRRGRLPVPELMRVAREVTAGLAAAHAAGLVHRDVKPANTWLEAPTGRAKLLDFGLAVAGETSVGGFAGTPGYAAPEQVRGEPADARADLFALGCVLYRAASGASPFAADTPAGSLARTLADPPPPLAAGDLPPGLARLVARLLAKDPADRPASAAAVAAELDTIADARRKRAARRNGALAAAAVAAGGVGLWWLWPAASPIDTGPDPVRVEFVTDADTGPLVATRDGADTPLAPATEAVVSLAPGTYALRPAVAVPDRTLVPAAFTVRPGEPRVVKVALAGLVATHRGHDADVTGVAAVPAAGGFEVRSAGLDRTLAAWDGRTGGAARHARLTSPARAFAATADGKWVVTAGGNKQPPLELGVRLADGRTLDAAGDPLAGHTRLPSAVAVSADGARVLTAATGELWLWSVADRAKRELVVHGDEKVLAAAFDPAGKLLLTGDDAGAVTLWDAATGEVRKRLTPTDKPVRAVAFVPGGFAAAGDDGVVRVWDAGTFAARGFPPQTAGVRAVAASADGRRLLTAGADGAVTLWSVADGTIAYTLTGHAGPVTAVGFTPDGRGAVSGGADRTVRVWRLPYE